VSALQARVAALQQALQSFKRDFVTEVVGAATARPAA
jgi:hypothetical protein